MARCPKCNGNHRGETCTTSEVRGFFDALGFLTEVHRSSPRTAGQVVLGVLGVLVGLYLFSGPIENQAAVLHSQGIEIGASANRENKPGGSSLGLDTHIFVKNLKREDKDWYAKAMVESERLIRESEDLSKAHRRRKPFGLACILLGGTAFLAGMASSLRLP